MGPCGVGVTRPAGRGPEAGIAGAGAGSEGLELQCHRLVAEDHRRRVWRWPALVIPTAGRAPAAGRPNAPAPAGSPAQRLTQARAIARRFSVSLQAPKPGRIQQRLLTQPLDRYGDPEAGLLDGVLFAFVGATNPNVLLVLEAWSEDAGIRTWRYALARESNVEETALLDGKPVWNGVVQLTG